MKVDEDRIIGMITGLPELTGWGEYLDLFSLKRTTPNVDWKLPVASCLAVGGDQNTAHIGAAVLACMQISIILVDDLLDNDPSGLFHKIGVGPTANLAFALQAAAHRILNQLEISSSHINRVNLKLSKMALITARGQSMDFRNRGTEEDYWRIVRNKSTPFYGFALELGSILGGSDVETQATFYHLGEIVGEVVQIHDDLFDAFKRPALPDWNRPENNLCLLYAISTEHSQSQDLVGYLQNIDEGDNLEKAQKILIECGAVSYCGFELIRRHNIISKIVQGMSLIDATELNIFLQDQITPLRSLLVEVGADLPSGISYNTEHEDE